MTDKVRHVKLDANGRAECECKLYDETEVMCIHIMAVARSGQLGKWAHLASNPLGAIWHNSLFVEAFKNFTALMPSPDEISACTGHCSVCHDGTARYATTLGTRRLPAPCVDASVHKRGRVMNGTRWYVS